MESLTSRSPAPDLPVWPVSQIVLDHCRFLDGFDSTSMNVQPWINTLTEQCRRNNPHFPPVFGFSYRAPGSHYEQTDTWESLERYVGLFGAHLALADTQIVPVGFSLGTNVVLVGTAEHLSDLSAAIPAVVLIAPVHAPDPDFIRQYEEYLASSDAATEEIGDLPDRPEEEPFPIPILELCAAGTPWRQRIYGAYSHLTAEQVHVHVIYSPEDLLARYNLPHMSSEQEPYFHSHPVTLPSDSRRPYPSQIDPIQEPDKRAEAEVKYHLRLRATTSQEVLRTVCSIVAEYLPRHR